jgi:hypothetical protein
VACCGRWVRKPRKVDLREFVESEVTDDAKCVGFLAALSSYRVIAGQGTKLESRCATTAFAVMLDWIPQVGCFRFEVSE